MIISQPKKSFLGVVFYVDHDFEGPRAPKAHLDTVNRNLSHHLGTPRITSAHPSVRCSGCPGTHARKHCALSTAVNRDDAPRSTLSAALMRTDARRACDGQSLDRLVWRR